MNSPQKRGSEVVNTAVSAVKTIPSKMGEFPPIRSRSPKKVATSSKRRHEDINKSGGLPRVAAKSHVSYAKNGEHLPQVLDSGEELEVLKCILVREGYLQRLGHASAQGTVSGSHLSETIDVLDLLRIATTEVVEAIVTWRIKQQRQSPQAPDVPVFMWNSINYLLKLASDLDFLEKHQGLVQWLGFTLVRNPFILPVNLTTRGQLDQRADSSQTLQTLPGSSRRHDSSSQFIQVGGKRVTVDLGLKATSALRAAQAAALAERKRAKNPYETRVLNDEELVPLARMGTTRTTSSAASDRPGSRAVAQAHVELPSQIGELDMTRIHVCEKIVLQEEAIHGRYTRDLKGLLVPESEAIRRRNMVELSSDAYARVRADADETSGKEEAGQVSFMGDHRGERGGTRTGLPPQAHAKKQAGMLGPISKPQQRKPVRKCPTDRSRGAHLEESLQRERRANVELGLLIDHVREEIERKEMDLAYFESFPGVQLYGNELDDFRRKTRADVAQLRRDVAEKEYVHNSRAANLNRKEEIIHVFKENRKRAVELERRTRLLEKRQEVAVLHGNCGTNQEVEGTLPNATKEVDDQPHARAQDPTQSGITVSAILPAQTQPIVHDMCATLIQKITRGKLARAAFEELKIEFYVGSKYIQAVVRGFLARRRVAKMYWQLTASILLQRFARGMLARRLVARKRHARARQHAALRIQRTVRGHFGRVRMVRVRRLFAGRRQLLRAVDELSLSDLRELAEACCKMAAVPTVNGHNGGPRPLTSLVLGLVRVLMIFTTDRDECISIEHVRWREVAHFLRCSSRLQRRLSKVAAIAATGEQYLRSSLLGTALLDIYSKDEDFNEHTFAHLETGWRAAMTLYRWVTAFHGVCQEQRVLEPIDGLRSMHPFLFAESTDAVEAMQERVEEEENTIREVALERRFVPRELVASAKPRSRAMLVVFAFDVPQTARQSILGHLRGALPGVFIVMNRRHDGVDESLETSQKHPPRKRLPKAHKHQLGILGADYSSIRESLAVGHGVVLDCDIGLTDAQQRQFIGAFSALKASIKPSPMCLLVRGALDNRQVLDSFDGEDSESAASPVSTTISSISGRRVMADADVKRAFEETADWLHRLSQPEYANEMLSTSAVDAWHSSTMAAAFVLVMEAVVILLTPTKRYDSPQPYTSGVSWRLARRLLGNPQFLAQKLASARYDSISDDNLRALNAYLAHSDWPSATLTHAANGGLLHALAFWVRSVVTCAQIALDRHGLASNISRSAPVPGLFDAVVVYTNFASAIGGDVMAFRELLDAALADVRVYRKVQTLDGRRCVVSVYHDCQRLYFCAYDPVTSWRWQRIVPEEEVDALLAPNSIERGQDAVGKRRSPPATQAEMYDQLAQLCLLQPVNSIRALVTDANIKAIGVGQEMVEQLKPDTQQLIVRPPAIRLFRRVVRLSGHRATVTLAELSRGRIQVDVTIHELSLELRQIVSLEQILERLSHQAARNVFIPPERIPAFVLDRLHLFRRMQSSASLLPPPAFSHTEDPMASSPLQLGVRTKEAAPGRVVLRTVIQSHWLPAQVGGHGAKRWILTVSDHHIADQFRVEVYQPQSCERFALAVSKREFQDLRLAELCQHPSSASAPPLLRVIVQQFQFQRGPEEDEDRPIRSCVLRHHMLVRFPLAIPFVVSPHHAVEKRGVVRVYAQVETNKSAQHEESVRVRICFPETCDEQAIVWRDAEVDSFFASCTISWTTAVRAERKRLAYELVRSVLRWDASKQRVVAVLPCGPFVATLCTRDTGMRKAVAPAKPPKRSKQSVFSAQSARALIPAPSSCVKLLDDVNEMPEQNDNHHVANRVLFAYDKDERIHSGSYRANGVLVTVQVFMRAVIVTVPKPRVPVDRLEQEDSFEMAFDFYHPPSSSSQRCVLYGRTQLREVVGPDKATLIASATVHELCEHIIEVRTSVHFETVETVKTHAEGEQIAVSFVRDRLYAKHKATPLQKTLDADAAVNASKLIDAKPDRGLKLLTNTKTIGDTTSSAGAGSKVILTVFGVRHTRSTLPGRDPDRDAPSHVQLRVDGYVCDSSARLSLSLEASDLVHIVDDEMALDLKRTNDILYTEEARRLKTRLAQLVIDHVGIERKRDGTPDRLFLVETSTLQSTAQGEENETKTRRMVGKTVRQVRHVPVVVTVFVVGDVNCDGFEIQCYAPQTSARAALFVPPTLLGLGPEDVKFSALLESLHNSSTAASLVKHAVSFVCMNTVDDSTLQLTVSTHTTMDQEQWACRSQFQRLEVGSVGLDDGGASSGFVMANVRHGLVAAASAGRELCVVHLGLQRPTEAHEVDLPSARLVCSVSVLGKHLGAMKAITTEEVNSISSPADEFLRECAARLRINVLPPIVHQETDGDSGSEPPPRSPRLVIELSKSR